MLTNLIPPPFCGPIILHKKQATDFFYIPPCNWNLRFLSIAVTVHITNKQLNQTVIIDHLKITCGQSQTTWNSSPDYKALGRKSLAPSDGGLQPPDIDHEYEAGYFSGFMIGMHRWTMGSPHKGSVMWQAFFITRRAHKMLAVVINNWCLVTLNRHIHTWLYKTNLMLICC